MATAGAFPEATLNLGLRYVYESGVSNPDLTKAGAARQFPPGL